MFYLIITDCLLVIQSFILPTKQCVSTAFSMAGNVADCLSVTLMYWVLSSCDIHHVKCEPDSSTRSPSLRAPGGRVVGKSRKIRPINHSHLPEASSWQHRMEHRRAQASGWFVMSSYSHSTFDTVGCLAIRCTIVVSNVRHISLSNGRNVTALIRRGRIWCKSACSLFFIFWKHTNKVVDKTIIYFQEN